jgi:hypothetical protein
MPLFRQLIQLTQPPLIDDDVIAWIVIAVVFFTGSATLWVPTAIALGWF